MTKFCGQFRKTPTGNTARQNVKKRRSLLVPGSSAVRAAPDFVVTGGNYNLRRVALHINMSYVGTKLLAFDGRLHLHPSYSAIGGVEERARLPARPYIARRGLRSTAMDDPRAKRFASSGRCPVTVAGRPLQSSR